MKKISLCSMLFLGLILASCDTPVKVSGSLTASPDPVYYSYGGGSCDSVLKFQFYWPPPGFPDYKDHFIDIPEVTLRYDIKDSGGPVAGAYLTMIPPVTMSSTMDYSTLMPILESLPYTASLNMSELSSDLKFGGKELTLVYSIKARAGFIEPDKSTTSETILYTDDQSVKVYPCIPVLPYTLEPGQYTLTPSLTPIPSDTPTNQPISTPAPTDTPEKKRCIPSVKNNFHCP